MARSKQFVSFVFSCFRSLLTPPCFFFCVPIAVDFFNQINLLYGSVSEYCTDASCAVMSAGPKYEYWWADGDKIKKPIKCSAPEYMDYLMSWVQGILDDESVFPSRVGSFEHYKSCMKHTYYCCNFIAFFACRCSIPKEFCVCCQTNLQAIVPCLCPYLLQPFPKDCKLRRRSSLEYLLQT